MKSRKLDPVNSQLTYLSQTEWELESRAGAGTVEAEVKRSFSFGTDKYTSEDSVLIEFFGPS